MEQGSPTAAHAQVLPSHRPEQHSQSLAHTPAIRPPEGTQQVLVPGWPKHVPAQHSLTVLQAAPTSRQPQQPSRQTPQQRSVISSGLGQGSPATKQKPSSESM
jgi:hypothetical protein